MKATGIIRKVDELGRIVVPVELRKKLNITPIVTDVVYSFCLLVGSKY